jgi:UDP-glucose 4-epimerase
LITGGSGFLGRYIVKEAEKFGEVIVADNLEPHCGGREIGQQYLDVTDFEAVEDILERYKITHILHLAAYGRNLSCRKYPKRAWEVNVNGTLNILEAAHQSSFKPRVVVCSSNIVLSDQPTVYKYTKSAAENLVSLYAGYGVSCIALRPSNIYGEGQSRTELQPCAFAGLDMNYEETGKFVITGDGTQSRDFIHASDVARAFLLASESTLSGITLDICTGIQSSMNEIASLLHVPVDYTDSRPGDAKTLISDPSSARTELKFEARVQLKDSILDAFPSVKTKNESSNFNL